LTLVPGASETRFSTLGLGGGFIVGAFRWVITASTPGSASAMLVPMARMRPRVMVA